ncbi:hypothetical protein N1851_008245 [Merluccius polli]|uniref:Reverse transcriptase n=1 Tax=Merluccius polli TaxID=89951 RepID=A0AA47P8V4_MERPO|nr:hypothetical protein N1851_008245 [Merluccius polli]
MAAVFVFLTGVLLIGVTDGQWRFAEGVWIPKEENAKNIEQFRTISLLSVEGKIFFAILSRRLTEFLLKNEYIDTAVQKGGIPKVPGCLEHTGVVTQLIREAREGKGDLAVLWLDLTNAYGSIPHKLVETALERHHVPGKIRDLRDKSGLPGKFKAWIYQHGVLPRILWPLLVYEFPITTVEGFERRISRYLRRWLGLPRSLSSIAVYGQNNRLKLPISSLNEEFMVTRVREVLQYRESSDPKVSQAGIVVRTGRKWRAREAVEQAESRLRHSVLVGPVASGRAGLGSVPTTRYDKALGKDRRRLVQEEVRAGVEELRASQMVGMRQQGAWTRWEQAVDRKISWSELWQAEPHRIKFLIASVYDVLPSPSNLFCWGKVDTPSCPLCLRRGTLEHILSCCPKALGEGRYTWRHDQVLKAIAEAIFTSITQNKPLRPARQAIAFIRAGEKPKPQPRGAVGLLGTAPDWQMKADLGKQLRFPEHIVETTLRPDIVLFSDVTRQVVLLELTVPWEERMEEANERKRAKYTELVEECRRRGWRARCVPIEVGCRGFAARSLCKVYSLLGITGAHQRKAIKTTTEAAEKASRWLWIKRGDPWVHAT